jgi:hypothetical protein
MASRLARTTSSTAPLLYPTDRDLIAGILPPLLTISPARSMIPAVAPEVEMEH